MAEGWANHLGKNYLIAMSAGIEAHGKNPRAIAVMKEVGVDISHQESTRLTPTMLTNLNLVVTVCGHADEHCPVLPPEIRKIHWPLEDPAKASGTEEEIMATFRASRDEIHLRLVALVESVKTQAIFK